MIHGKNYRDTTFYMHACILLKEQSQKFNIRCHAIIWLFLFAVKQINTNIKVDCQKRFVSLQKNKSCQIYH